MLSCIFSGVCMQDVSMRAFGSYPCFVVFCVLRTTERSVASKSAANFVLLGTGDPLLRCDPWSVSPCLCSKWNEGAERMER